MSSMQGLRLSNLNLSRNHMNLSGMCCIALLAVAATCWADPKKDNSIPFQTYSGYFVSNQFEPDAPDSFVVIRDQATFDKVFGAGFVMNDTQKRLPKNAFDSLIVIAPIKRSHADCHFTIESVTLKDGIVNVRYEVVATPTPNTVYACFKMISIPKGNYKAVEFVENGQLEKSVPVKAAG